MDLKMTSGSVAEFCGVASRWMRVGQLSVSDTRGVLADPEIYVVLDDPDTGQPAAAVEQGLGALDQSKVQI
jgi:hypothetical protein